MACRSRLLGVFLLALVMLTGCGWQGTGVIEEKTHSAAYDYMSFICGSYSTNGTCVVQVPITNYVPESWGYRVRDDKGDIHDVSVNYQYWAIHGVGEPFDNREKK